MGAQLIFSENNNSVCVKFANGAQTPYYHHKEVVVDILSDYLRQKKIEQEEFFQFTKEVILNPCILFEYPDRYMLDIRNVFFEIIASEAVSDKIIEPYIELCECDTSYLFKHAFIFNHNGSKISPPFLCKDEGLDFVWSLTSFVGLSISDENRLNALVDILDLPENFEMN